MTKPNNSDALFIYLLEQSSSGSKNWFGFQQQRLAGIHLAYKIAENHADSMSPEQITDFVSKLNNSVYAKLIKGD